MKTLSILTHHMSIPNTAKPSAPRQTMVAGSDAPPTMTEVSKPAIPVILSAFERGTDPQVFKDAMIVRTTVFVKEQLVPAENELDDDDTRSFHIVAYGSGSSSGKACPAGTIRVVPAQQSRSNDADAPQSIYIKLGRLAVLKEYRGFGIAKQLVNAAVKFASENPSDMVEAGGLAWNGMCLVHAQTVAVGMWVKCGFEVDEDMGEWDEEGMMHKGMWRKIL